MTEDQIKHMVQRFLGWKLPADFQPDGGVKFDADEPLRLDPRNRRHEPHGTNLLDARQAEAMVRYIVAALPLASPAPQAPAVGLIERLRNRIGSALGYPGWKDRSWSMDGLAKEFMEARDWCNDFLAAEPEVGTGEDAPGDLASLAGLIRRLKGKTIRVEDEPGDYSNEPDVDARKAGEWLSFLGMRVSLTSTPEAE